MSSTSKYERLDKLTGRKIRNTAQSYENPEKKFGTQNEFIAIIREPIKKKWGHTMRSITKCSETPERIPGRNMSPVK